MSFIASIFGPLVLDSPRQLLGRNQAQRIRLSEYRMPWFNYWLEPGGDGFYVVGGAKRKATLMIPTLFPTKAIARSIAKYMCRSSRIRVERRTTTLIRDAPTKICH